eukprot:g7605.t1
MHRIEYVDWLVDCQQLIAVHGWERLYDGLEPSIVGAAFSQGIYFYFYSTFMKRSEDKRRSPVEIPESLFNGYLAGCLNVVLTNPIWVIATRVQAYRRRDESLWNSVLTAFATDGYDWMSKGIVPSLILASNPAIQFCIYELLKRKKMSTGEESLSTYDVFLIMTVAKLGATILTYPLLTVKTRLQVYGVHSRHQYQNMWDAFQTMYKEEGWTGLYNGLSAKCVQSICAATVTMVVKEKVVSVFSRKRQQRQPKRKQNE